MPFPLLRKTLIRAEDVMVPSRGGKGPCYGKLVKKSTPIGKDLGQTRRKMQIPNREDCYVSITT